MFKIEIICEKIREARGVLEVFDAEYNPEGTKNGPYGIFTLGMMDENGKTKQLFLDNIKDEKKMLYEFRNWLITENPVLVSYGSTSADKPQLINSFKRYNLPIDELKKSFFDIYYDCIFTQSVKKQYDTIDRNFL